MIWAFNSLQHCQYTVNQIADLKILCFTLAFH